MILKKLFFALLLLFPLCVNAQSSSESKLGCIDKVVAMQASESKTALNQQGFEILKNAMIELENKEDFSIVMKLNKGVFYQFQFIGQPKAKKLSMKIQVGKKEIIFSKSVLPYKNSENNIAYYYTPGENEVIQITINQTQSKLSKDGCVNLSAYQLKQK
jgi:hypothetical protein